MEASWVQEASVACGGYAWTKNKPHLSSEHTDWHREIKRQQDRGETETEEEEKGEEEENQSETVIRLQSALLSDLFRILNRQSGSTKTKDETIIR